MTHSNNEINVHDYQLGLIMADVIMSNYYPTLDIDYFKSNIVLNVDHVEFLHHKILSDKCGDLADLNAHLYNVDEHFKMIKFQYAMAHKYLPNPLIITYTKLVINDAYSFKEGLIDKLSDSDMFIYVLEHDDIQIQTNQIKTLIKFKLKECPIK